MRSGCLALDDGAGGKSKILRDTLESTQTGVALRRRALARPAAGLTPPGQPPA